MRCGRRVVRPGAKWRVLRCCAAAVNVLRLLVIWSTLPCASSVCNAVARHGSGVALPCRQLNRHPGRLLLHRQGPALRQSFSCRARSATMRSPITTLCALQAAEWSLLYFVESASRADNCFSLMQCASAPCVPGACSYCLAPVCMCTHYKFQSHTCQLRLAASAVLRQHEARRCHTRIPLVASAAALGSPQPRRA